MWEAWYLLPRVCRLEVRGVRIQGLVKASVRMHQAPSPLIEVQGGMILRDGVSNTTARTNVDIQQRVEGQEMIVD